MPVANELPANPSSSLPPRIKTSSSKISLANGRPISAACPPSLRVRRIQIYWPEFGTRTTSESSFAGEEIGEQSTRFKESLPAGISRPIVIAGRFVPIKVEWRGKDAISEITNRGGKWSRYLRRRCYIGRVSTRSRSRSDGFTTSIRSRPYDCVPGRLRARRVGGPCPSEGHLADPSATPSSLERIYILYIRVIRFLTHVTLQSYRSFSSPSNPLPGAKAP